MYARSNNVIFNLDNCDLILSGETSGNKQTNQPVKLEIMF